MTVYHLQFLLTNNARATASYALSVFELKFKTIAPELREDYTYYLIRIRLAEYGTTYRNGIHVLVMTKTRLDEGTPCFFFVLTF